MSLRGKFRGLVGKRNWLSCPSPGSPVNLEGPCATQEHLEGRDDVVPQDGVELGAASTGHPAAGATCAVQPAGGRAPPPCVVCPKGLSQAAGKGSPEDRSLLGIWGTWEIGNVHLLQTTDVSGFFVDMVSVDPRWSLRSASLPLCQGSRLGDRTVCWRLWYTAVRLSRLPRGEWPPDASGRAGAPRGSCGIGPAGPAL